MGTEVGKRETGLSERKRPTVRDTVETEGRDRQVREGEIGWERDRYGRLTQMGKDR